MKTLAVEFPLARLCEVFELSRSGYYAWLKRKPSRRQRADQQLLPQLHQAYAQGRGAYGSPRGSLANSKRGASSAAGIGWPA